MILSTTKVSPNEVAKHYDELDPYYREIWGESLHHGLWKRKTDSRERAVMNLTRDVARRAKLEPGNKVLDVGCGYGAPAQHMAQEYDVHVTGLTLSAQQLASAQNRTTENGSITFHLQDFLTGKFKTSSFDAVIAIESTEHMSAKLRFFQEAHRILKPGGRLVVCFWSACEEPSRLSRKFLLEPICTEGRMPSLISFSEAKDLSRHAGFKSRISDLSESVQKTWSEIMVRTVEHFGKNPARIRDLSVKNLPSADFARSLARILIAYHTGSLKYGVLTAEKSGRKKTVADKRAKNSLH
jgi:tocopherol O-methyltransferase